MFTEIQTEIAVLLTDSVAEVAEQAAQQARAELQYGACRDLACECLFQDQTKPEYRIYQKAFAAGEAALEKSGTWAEIEATMMAAAYVEASRLSHATSM